MEIRSFDFSKAEEVLLHQTNWWWMLLSLFFGVMSHVLRGWRWKQTLEPLDAHPKTSDCVDAIFVSYATNLVLPRVGEVSRCGVLAKYDNVSFAKSLGTVVTERLVDTLCILLITGITFLVQMPVFFRFFEETGTKIPSLMHLVTSPWFYVALFSIIGVLVLLYFLLRMLTIFVLKLPRINKSTGQQALSLYTAHRQQPAIPCLKRGVYGYQKFQYKRTF